MFYAEINLANVVVNLVKQGQYPGALAAIFGPMHPINPMLFPATTNIRRGNQ